MSHKSIFPIDSSDGTIAAYYLYGMESGLFALDSAKEWAYQVIESRSNPAIEIIEVATALHRQDVFSCLAAVSGPANHSIAGYWLLHQLHEKLQAGDVTVRFAVQAALQIARTTELPERVYYDFDGLEDELSLAEQGAFGTISEATDSVLASLLEYGQAIASGT